MKGSDIKKRRKELGWKQADLAQRMGVSVNTVSTWENGGSIPNTSIKRLEEVLYGTEKKPIDMQIMVNNKRSDIYEAKSNLISVIDEIIAEKRKTIETIEAIEYIQTLLKIQTELVDDIQKLIKDS